MKRNLTTAHLPDGKARPARPLLGKLLKWTVLAVLALTITSIALYAAGSYRKASDGFQLAILRFCLVFSTLLVISSVYGIILNLYYAVRKRQAAYLAGVLGYTLAAALGGGAALGAGFIIGAVGGNR